MDNSREDWEKNDGVGNPHPKRGLLRSNDVGGRKKSSKVGLSTKERKHPQSRFRDRKGKGQRGDGTGRLRPGERIFERDLGFGSEA